MLDDWQAFVLEASLRKDEAGKWAAKEVGLNVARQNGKNVVLLARELAELFLVQSQLTIHSAHEFATSIEHFFKFRELVEETPSWRSRSSLCGCAAVRRGSSFRISGRIGFGRGRRAARGFSCDLLIFDEAMFLPEMAIGALFPTKRAARIRRFGTPARRLIGRCMSMARCFRLFGSAASTRAGKLAYFEWSVEGDNPSTMPADVMSDRAAWAQANPALGSRIPVETMEDEYEERSICLARSLSSCWGWVIGRTRIMRLRTRSAWRRGWSWKTHGRGPAI